MKKRVLIGLVVALALVVPYLGSLDAHTSNAVAAPEAVAVTSYRLRHRVTFDGQISSPKEWADTMSYDIPLDRVWGWPNRQVEPSDKVVTARFKNDGEWVYMLYQILWPEGTDPNDGASIALFWGSYVPPWDNSDTSWVGFDQTTWDAYGWDDTTWYTDTEASPPGENNVEGAASHDGTYYWFEFRKELNSGDGRDWALAPPQVVGNPSAPDETPHLIIGVWDHSILSKYEQYISLKLSGPTTGPERLWVADFTYDVPSGTWSEGLYTYHFEFTWTEPEPGSSVTPTGEFEVSSEAPLYPGFVLLRGFYVLAQVTGPEGARCERIDAFLDPDQPTRFHIGWLTDEPMTAPEARAHFESMSSTVVWDGGLPVDLVRHQILPWQEEMWKSRQCSWTMRP